MRRIVAKQLALVLYLMPAVALSQVWLPDRDTREGAGFKLGESLVLHPGAAVEGGYDNNPLRKNESPKGAGRLRLSSYVDIATRSKDRLAEDEEVEDATPQKVDFRFGLAGFYDFFFAGSDAKGVDKQDDFGIDTHLNFTLFPDGPYSFWASMNYLRTLQPYESPEEWHARHGINPRLGVRARPGGGTLSLSLSYGANFLLYEEKDVAATHSKVAQDLRLESSWKVLPKTAIISLVRFSPMKYLGNAHINNNSRPVRGLFGIRGLLTAKFGLSLFAGYGTSFYRQGDDFDGVIAHGELMFFPTPFSNIRLGGQRDFVDSFYANYYVKTGGYLKFEQMFGKVFLVSLRGDVFHRRYSTLSQYPPGAFEALPQEDRTDVVLGATLLLEYRIKEWISVMASCVYQGNVTDFTYQTASNEDPDNTVEYPVKYHKVEAMAGVRVHY